MVEIILCGKCNGRGNIERSELEDYHNNIRKKWLEDCKTCESSGRIVKNTVITFYPYKANNNNNA